MLSLCSSRRTYGQVYVSVVVDTSIEPVEQEDGRVVVHVEEGKLLPLLPDYDEDSVPEIPDLGEVEDVEDGTDRGGCGGEILTGDNGVVVAVGDETWGRGGGGVSGARSGTVTVREHGKVGSSGG